MKREFPGDNKQQKQHDQRSMFSELHLRTRIHSQPISPPQADVTHSPRDGDGATIEVVRRRRGRPPGSKNKPKQPMFIAREVEEPSMSPYVLELPVGIDVVESIGRFCRKRGVGLAVLNGHGVVSNVTLKQPSGATVTFHGRFDILSISAAILPGTGTGSDLSSSGNGEGQLTIFLAGPQGQVVGGLVVGPLTAAGTIYLIAATFNSPAFERLPPPAEHPESPPAAVSGGDSGGGGGTPIYTNYQSSDVIWTPTPRAPPTHY